MFVCASTLVLAIAASVIALPGGVTVNQCNTGELQCCDEMMPASQAANILGLDTSGLEGIIGLNCNQILPVLSGGASCTAQSVCCNGVNTVGFQVIGMDCSPVNLNL